MQTRRSSASAVFPAAVSGGWMALRPSATRRQGAFTLIELLVATVIMSLLLYGIHSVFYSAMKLRKRTTEVVEQGLPMQQALMILKRDFANLVPPGGTLFGQFQSAPTNENSLSTTASGGRRISPDLYTATGVLDTTSPWAQVQKVSYSLASPTNGTIGFDLVRSISRNLLPVTTDLPTDRTLLSGVLNAWFQFYDGSQWLDRWDASTVTNSLPLAVRVQIEMISTNLNLAGGAAPVSLVVPIVVQARSTNQVEQTEGGGA